MRFTIECLWRNVVFGGARFGDGGAGAAVAMGAIVRSGGRLLCKRRTGIDRFQYVSAIQECNNKHRRIGGSRFLCCRCCYRLEFIEWNNKRVNKNDVEIEGEGYRDVSQDLQVVREGGRRSEQGYRLRKRISGAKTAERMQRQRISGTTSGQSRLHHDQQALHEAAAAARGTDFHQNGARSTADEGVQGSAEAAALEDGARLHRGAGRRQPVRMARADIQVGPGERPRRRHEGARHQPHPAAPRLPRELPVRAAVHARHLAADREGFRDGGWRHLHGAAHAQGMGERLHRGSSHHAVRGERRQRSGSRPT